jgi:hypothetical protein
MTQALLVACLSSSHSRVTVVTYSGMRLDPPAATIEIHRIVGPFEGALLLVVPRYPITYRRYPNAGRTTAMPSWRSQFGHMLFKHSFQHALVDPTPWRWLTLPKQPSLLCSKNSNKLCLALVDELGTSSIRARQSG